MESISSRTGIISDVCIRVAHSDWCPSRRVVSVMPTGRARMALLPRRAQARPRYSPLRVSTLTFSPSSMNSGTWMVAPDSRVAGFVAPWAVLP